MEKETSKWTPHLGCWIETVTGCCGVLTTAGEVRGLTTPRIKTDEDDDILVAFYPGNTIQAHPINDVAVAFICPLERVESIAREE